MLTKENIPPAAHTKGKAPAKAPQTLPSHLDITKAAKLAALEEQPSNVDFHMDRECSS